MLQRTGFLLLVARLLVAQTAVVEGVVTNSVTHGPISGVTVQLTAANAKEPAYQTATDGAGGFRFATVEPGTYFASYEKDRFDGPDDDPASKALAVATGDAVSVREEMIPLGTIHGRVVDAEGRPVGRIRVDWLTSAARRVNGSVNTDSEGRFTVEDVRPGSYVLRATPNQPANPQRVVSLADLMKPALDAAVSRRPLYAPVYYPNSTDRLQASAITVRGGEELAGFDIHMRAVEMYRVRGVVRDEKGEPAAGMSVKLRSADTWYFGNDFPPDALVVSAADGSFDFPSVAAGDWQITAERRRGPASPLGYAAIAVTHHDLDAVEVRMFEPFALSGMVERIDPAGNTEGVKSVRVALLPVERPRDQEAMGHSAANGSLSIHYIYPGRYRIISYMRIPGYYLDSVWLGNSEVLGKDVDLAPGSPALRIVYRADGGGVRGTVENGGNAAVVLVPSDPMLLNPAFIRKATCDDAGRFEMDGLRPGSYYALAFGELDFDRLEDPGFVSSLVARANGVHVGRNEVAPVDLKLTPWPN